MKKLVSAVVAAATLCAASAAVASPEWWHSSVSIDNRSHYAIFHLYLTEWDKAAWGKDWLGSDVLQPGETVQITGLECDKYDLKLVDEDGDVCVVQDIDLCLEDADWDLTDLALHACQGFAKLE